MHKSVTDFAFDEANNIVVKYIELFKQEVLTMKLCFPENEQYYQGMIDGLIAFKEIISPQTTPTQESQS